MRFANHHLSPLAVLAAAALLASGCSSESRGNTPDESGEPRGELVVFAAASLTDAFSAIAEDFEQLHPGVSVTLSFAGSQSLRTQIQNGAQAQVFASANGKHMSALQQKGLVAEPTIFANNELVIVVPKGNPASIKSLADLASAERLVLAGATVPAGAYSEQVLQNASQEYGADFARRVLAKAVSRETHVRQTLQKVVLGEADAAIVYATDAASTADKIETIKIHREHNVVAAYPIAAVSDVPRARLGRLFVEFVLSEPGRASLTKFGFQPPASKQ